MATRFQKTMLGVTIASIAAMGSMTLPVLSSIGEPSALDQARFDHMSVNASDFDGMIAWYRDKLGFEMDVSWRVTALGGKQLAYLSKNGATIEIVAADEGATPVRKPADFGAHFGRTGWGHFCFVVADVDAALAELRARGVRTFVPARTYPLDGTPFSRRVGFIMDPEGNVIEFAEPLQTRG